MADLLERTHKHSPIILHMIQMAMDDTTIGGQGIPNENIFYGDQVRIPRVPALCIFGGVRARGLEGIVRTDNNITVYLILYYMSARESSQLNAQKMDVMAEELEELLHTDLQMGGLVTHGYVRSVEPGWAMRENGLMQATRLTWQGYNRTSLRATD